MTPDNRNVPLSEGFDGRNEHAWRTAIDKILKGGDFARRLVSKTADGISLQPLYMQAADKPPVPSSHTGQPWQIAQRVDHPDPQAANKLALQDLENGANNLVLVMNSSTTARGFGLRACDTATLETALRDVALDMITVRLEAGDNADACAHNLASLVANRGLDPASVHIDFGFAPLTHLMATGVASQHWATTATALADTIRQLADKRFCGPFIAVDVRPVSEAGGSEAQELAVAIALAVEYLRALEANGFSLVQAASTMSFTLPIDAGQFEGTAKVRALRKLWGRIQQASAIPPRPIHIHAETAWRMATRRDAGVNMLRATMATFTAGIAGADSICVLPHTLALGLPDGFSRRIARNTQTVLLEESNLFRVTDPAAGAGAIESLTDELCQAAWNIFQEIEKAGGLLASLAAGAIQGRINVMATERAGRLATRREPVTGTSEFPQIDEPASSVLDVSPEHPMRVAGGAIVVQPLPSHRLAEPYEALRDAADAATERTGVRPAIFLANLGPVAEHTARAMWITNLLAAGGIAVIPSDGFTNSADAGAALAASGATIACICSNDTNYETLGEATAMALRSAGAEVVLLAGKPGTTADLLRAAGVDDFLYAGIDVLAALRSLQTKLGI